MHRQFPLPVDPQHWLPLAGLIAAFQWGGWPGVAVAAVVLYAVRLFYAHGGPPDDRLLPGPPGPGPRA